MKIKFFFWVSIYRSVKAAILILRFTSTFSSFIFVSVDRLRQKLNRTNQRLVSSDPALIHNYTFHNCLIVYNKYESTLCVINYFKWSFQSLPLVDKTQRALVMISRAALLIIKKSALGIPRVNCFNDNIFKRRFVEDGG